MFGGWPLLSSGGGLVTTIIVSDMFLAPSDIAGATGRLLCQGWWLSRLGLTVVQRVTSPTITLLEAASGDYAEEACV